MITTVTLSPSVDRTVRVPVLTPGAVHITDLVREDPGGKGVNVSRALAAQGGRSHAIVVAGGERAGWLEKALLSSGATVSMISISTPMRTNLTVLDDFGLVTKLNEPGPVIDDSIVAAVEQEIDRSVDQEEWVVLAGRLPAGLSDDAYARLTKSVHARGAKVAVDCDGAALAAAIEEAPDLIKPNISELSGLVGVPLNTFGDVIDASKRLIYQGLGSVLCSMGPDGALFVDAHCVSHVAPLQALKGTPVGAGDVLLAGFLANGATAEALASAVQWSAAAVRLPGTGVPTHEQSVGELVVESDPIDLDRRIQEV
jgi:1-phosphofructokinase